MQDKLTIEQLKRIIANHESGVQLTGVNVYRQLLATMQREEHYLSCLKAIRKHQEIVGANMAKLGTTWHMANNAIKRYEVQNDG